MDSRGNLKNRKEHGYVSSANLRRFASTECPAALDAGDPNYQEEQEGPQDILNALKKYNSSDEWSFADMITALIQSYKREIDYIIKVYTF